MGGSLGELDDVVPIKELVETAESLGQDLVPQLVEESGLSEVELSESQSAGLAAQTAGFRLTVPSGTILAATSPYTRLMVWNDNKYVQNVLRYGTIEKQMDVRVVYETRRQTDNFAKGVITAHCVGPVICPQWVRDVAG